MSKNTMHDSTATASRPGTGNTPAPAALRKSLKNRHVQLIALGGAIGTGLFYGSSESIALAGPSILLAYLVGGLAIFMIVRALGESRSKTRGPVRSATTRPATGRSAPAS